MSLRSVHGATAASDAQPSRKPERARTDRNPTPAEDTAAGTFPRGVGGHPQRIDWARLGAIIAAAVFVGGFWSAIGLLLAGLTLGVFLFAIPLAMVGGVWLAERFWPSAGDRLAAVLDAETSDERRVRGELYRPGSRAEVSPVDVSLSEFEWERRLEERYDRSWDEPEF